MKELSHYQDLYRKYLLDQLSDTEMAELREYFGLADDESLSVVIDEISSIGEPSTDSGKLTALTGTLWEGIEIQTQPQPRKISIAWRKYISVAAALLLILFSVLILTDQIHLGTHVLPVTDVTAGRTRATLRLSDGRTFDVEKAQSGEIYGSAGNSVVKTKDGELVYNTNAAAGEKIIDNVLSVPRGGEFQVVLPDGSKVWLNSESSLTFPERFSGPTREVRLSGEAYFQVAKNAAIPFVVTTSKERVQVLGTHFNINTYADEPASVTTLEEGSVKVSPLSSARNTDDRSVILKPGEQAINSNSSFEKRTANLDNALGWKDGKLYFEGSDIHTILRQAARWYDIDVRYEKEIGKEQFTGGVSRKSNLSALIKVLKISGLNTKLQTEGTQKVLIVY